VGVRMGLSFTGWVYIFFVLRSIEAGCCGVWNSLDGVGLVCRRHIWKRRGKSCPFSALAIKVYLPPSNPTGCCVIRTLFTYPTDDKVGAAHLGAYTTVPSPHSSLTSRFSKTKNRLTEKKFKFLHARRALCANLRVWLKLKR